MICFLYLENVLPFPRKTQNEKQLMKTTHILTTYSVDNNSVQVFVKSTILLLHLVTKLFAICFLQMSTLTSYTWWDHHQKKNLHVMLFPILWILPCILMPWYWNGGQVGQNVGHDPWLLERGLQNSEGSNPGWFHALLARNVVWKPRKLQIYTDNIELMDHLSYSRGSQSVEHD